MVKNKKIEDKQYKVVVLVLLFLTIVSLFSIIFTSKIEVEAQGSCKIGYTGVEYNSRNYVQDYPCEVDGNKFFCYKQDRIKGDFSIKDIENLECEGTTKAKIPLIMLIQ